MARVLDQSKAKRFTEKANQSESDAAEKFSKEEDRLEGMAKGGKVRATGKRMLHKGESVARKAKRCKARGGGR